MLREIIIACVAGAIGYIIGVRAGFDAGVRDYLDDGELLERVAISKDKFEYGGAADEKETKESHESTGFR